VRDIHYALDDGDDIYRAGDERERGAKKKKIGQIFHIHTEQRVFIMPASSLHFLLLHFHFQIPNIYFPRPEKSFSFYSERTREWKNE
jgi:hypothetical protein